ncbi:MAG: type IV pili methyl-accepting chemotaxis transducer N-terminal domain-containing protein, partial [Desulfuromusa sp.]|nr:type IV pili methyl-accepting chemotaxis transducer N-terminal domain-containing protein [Desulfuromusa sp.]
MSQSKSFGLSAKLTGAICVITLICILLVAFTVVTLKNQKNDSTIINIAGRQRMLSQKMSKEAMTIKAGLSVEKCRNNLKETHDLFDSSLKGLISGNSSMHLPPTSDPKILTQMRKVESLWKEFSNQVQIILNSGSNNDQIDQAVYKILGGNVPLLKEMNKAVGMYAAQSQKKIVRLTSSLYIGGVIVLIATFFIWLLINRKIV